MTSIDSTGRHGDHCVTVAKDFSFKQASVPVIEGGSCVDMVLCGKRR